MSDEVWNRYSESYPSIHRFLQHVKDVCNRAEVEVQLIDDSSVNTSDSVAVGGYFDSESSTLVCVIQDPNQSPGEPPRWVTLLAHEFSHLLQWQEDCEPWVNCTYKTYDCNLMLDMWLNHAIELNDEQLTSCINAVADLELDCEKRTVELIKEFDLPYDIAEYVQRSNAYVLHYQYIKRFRRWNCPGRAPSSCKEVYSRLSTEFDMDYKSPMSAELEEIFSKSYDEP